MSGPASYWVWGLEIKPATAKIVMLCLAHCHNNDTGQCNPSIKTISEMTGVNVKTIPKAIKTLAAMGLIEVKKKGKHSPDYILPIPQNRGIQLPKNGIHQNRSIQLPKMGSTDTPKLGNEHKREHKKNINIYRNLDCSNVPQNILDAVREFIDHRRNLKKPLTQQALSRFLTAVDRSAAELKIPPENVIAETIDAGWQTVKTDWLRNRLEKSDAKIQPSGNSGTHVQPKLTPAQRVKARREEQRQRELAQQSPDVGAMGSDVGDLWPQVDIADG